MKNIIILSANIALWLFSFQSVASSQLCEAADNDCAFVLLSEKFKERVSKVITEVSPAEIDDKVSQRTTYSESNEIMLIINTARSNQPLSPFSTFKIPNTLIAFDSGQITDIKQVLTYNKEKYPAESWWPSSWNKPEHNILTAFKASVVPIYRQIATEIGVEKMQYYLDNFAYGNQDISSGIDNFWLDGSLKISAIEQVKFLQKMHKGQLALNQQSTEQLKEVMLVEKNHDYALYAKTGTGKTQLQTALKEQEKKSVLGWYVGFVENQHGVHYFALNISRNNYKGINDLRVNMVKNHLRKAGVI